MKNSVKISILNTDTVVFMQPGGNLLSGLLRNKIEISNGCGGMGTCTTCRVILVDGALAERNEIEQERAIERGFSANERLSCQCFVNQDLEIEIP